MNAFKDNRFESLIGQFGKNGSILVIGDIGVDKYTFGEVLRISPEAPVPVLEVRKEWFKLGMAANITENLKDLQVSSCLCGIVGQDRNALVLHDLLNKDQLSNEFIFSMEGRPTTYKERITTSIQQICRVDYEQIRPIDLQMESEIIAKVEQTMGQFHAVIIQDYGKGMVTEHLVRKLIQLFKDDHKMIFIDPGRKTSPYFYKGATLLKPNKIEAQNMVSMLGYHDKDVKAMASILADKLEIEKIIITLGAEGMALLDSIESQEQKFFNIIPTVANEVYDVSGAGDTAISAIAASLLAGATLEEAAWIGNCAAGVVVGKRGTATVTQKELLQFYHNLVQKLQ